MLKKNNRLTKKKDFERLFQLGSVKYYGDILGVRIIANQLNYNRVGIIVSKKMCRLAVNRNRLRRQISTLIHQSLALFFFIIFIFFLNFFNFWLQFIDRLLRTQCFLR